MALPVLANWTDTRIGLHQATQVIGAIRAAAVGPEPNYVHLGLNVVPRGLTTGDLPSIGRFTLQFDSMTILYARSDGDPVGFSLVQHSQKTLADAIEQTLTTFGHALTLNRDKLTGETVFSIKPQTAAAYAQLLSLLADIYERFRSGLPGETTRVIVWPHGFDLSFLWFATDTASEEAPHMAFGFSPGSEGFEHPYIYSYAHPIPDGLTDLPLPPDARWHTNGWTGMVLDYNNLIMKKTPDAVIAESLHHVYTTVSPLLTQ